MAAEAFELGEKRTGYDLKVGEGARNGKIVGVVHDFNYRSLRSKIEPLIITVISDTASHIPDDATLYIRLTPSTRIAEMIALVKKSYEKFSPDIPFAYYFLDDAFDDLQKGEERLGKLFGVFTFVALCVAGMGLFGLITFTAERRMKEISIRKVLGASIRAILALLSTELLVLIFTGVLIGCPIALLLMRRWLNNFFYQAGIPWEYAFVSCSAVGLLGFIILCAYGIKTAVTNPVKHLRNE